MSNVKKVRFCFLFHYSDWLTHEINQLMPFEHVYKVMKRTCMSVWIVISISGLYLKNKKDKLIVLMSPFAFCVMLT